MGAQETFADNMRAYRHHAGMTQEQLAEGSGLHRTYIGRIEQRRANITLKNAERIAQALGVDVALFFMDAGSPDTDAEIDAGISALADASERRRAHAGSGSDEGSHADSRAHADPGASAHEGAHAIAYAAASMGVPSGEAAGADAASPSPSPSPSQDPDPYDNPAISAIAEGKVGNTALCIWTEGGIRIEPLPDDRPEQTLRILSILARINPDSLLESFAEFHRRLVAKLSENRSAGSSKDRRHRSR